jgi:hypothetical protein
MDYLNWMAEHWVLTVVLTLIVMGGFHNALRAVLVAWAKK